MEELPQVSKLVGVLVEHQNLFESLSTKDRQWVIQNPREAICLFMQTVQNREAHVVPNLDAIMPKIFRLVVDYNMSLEQMIGAGHYDRIDENITAKNFPFYSKGVIEFDACYFQFENGISSNGAVKKIETADKEHPWSPANIEHLLSFGATFPEEQHKYPVIGLGSIVDFVTSYGATHTDKNVPCLVWDVSERYLDLQEYIEKWEEKLNSKKHDPVSRFLAIRKVLAS